MLITRSLASNTAAAVALTRTRTLGKSAATQSLLYLTGRRAMSTPSASASAEPLVLSEKSKSGKVVILRLNRPKALNALSSPLFEELNEALEKADHDESIGAIVLTGSAKAFAAGADIKEMKDKDFATTYKNNFLGTWTRIGAIRKPIIGAVSGFALGGGCELAMSLDMLLCTPTATFGQPEITLGIIPGAGGTQRLTQIIGKPRAMEMVLANRKIDGKTAEAWGLVSRCVAEGEDVVEEAVKVGDAVASYGAVAVQAGKEAVNGSLELPLEQGLRLERRLFQSLFATKDQKEGMAAFAEKRKPVWSHL